MSEIVCNDFVFQTTPFQHQLEGFMMQRDAEYFALLMEQGTGKTKLTIDTFSWLYSQGRIDAVLVVAPSGVQRNWVLNELPVHMPDYIQYNAAWYASSPTKREEEQLCKVLKFSQGLRFVSINIEALATKKGVSFVKNFLLNFRTFLVIDESQTIKNHSAIRTKNLLNLSVHAKYRRILTGTPVTQGPLDLFTQFLFLDGDILHTRNYYSFRGTYAVMREVSAAGRTFKVVQSYQNLEKLQALIAPHSFRVTKSECLDLPEKLYTKRYVQLSENQSKLYKQMKKDVIAEFNGKKMSAPLALTRLLRLQQIVGGFFTPDASMMEDEEFDVTYVTQKVEPQAIDETNPRVESLIELLQESPGKVIIWARFRAEIAAIVSRIEQEFGIGSVVQYHGGIKNDQRSDAVKSFQESPTVRFFVGHVQAGGRGLTLHAAQTVVYYSNSFSLENRLQSEDRAHRIGLKHNVTYVDMVAVDTLDEHIIDALRSKHDIADLITGDDKLEGWI